jgi:hypothetical protein
VMNRANQEWPNGEAIYIPSPLAQGMALYRFWNQTPQFSETLPELVDRVMNTEDETEFLRRTR